MNDMNNIKQIEIARYSTLIARISNRMVSWIGYQIVVFDFQVKSINEYLLKSDKIHVPRKKRFEQQFIDDVMSLFCMITRDIVDRYAQVK